LQLSGLPGMFFAGRCLSADHAALASVRVMGTCLATGQAAGVAAVASSSRPASTTRAGGQHVIGSISHAAADLKHMPHGALQLHLKMERVAGRNAAQDFELPHCGQPQVIEWWMVWPCLNQNATELCQGFDHDHAGQQRLPREMATKKFFVALQGPNPTGRLAGYQLCHLIDEAELGSVGSGKKQR